MGDERGWPTRTAPSRARAPRDKSARLRRERSVKGYAPREQTSAADPATAPRAQAARQPEAGPSPTHAPAARNSTNRNHPPQTFPSGCLLQRRRGAMQQARVSAKPLLDEHLERPDAVAPADLLALCTRARFEFHRQLMNAMAAAQHASGDLRLDVETVGVELERACDVGPHDFV